MPVPRTLLVRDEPADHDLRVTAGTWPEDASGELVISAPHPDTFDGPHAFFGDGMTYRLSLQPGTHGAAPGTVRVAATPHRLAVGPSAPQAPGRVRRRRCSASTRRSG